MIRTERMYQIRDSRNVHQIYVDRPERTVRVCTIRFSDMKTTWRPVDRDTAAAILWDKRQQVRRPSL